MTLNLNLPTSESQLTPKITVIGVGGAGGNAVNNMIQANLEGVDFLVANTDAQALNLSLCDHTVQIGRHITQGLGAGANPEVGRAAAEEAMDEILAALEGVNMVFIAAGMGGGTGTGAAPVIARATREAGILTVGVCTKPFQFEGIHRMQIAEAGLKDLQEYADTLIIIPNQNLFRVANEKTTFADAFKMADDVLHAGVRGVTDLIVMPGLINLDFADIRAVMSEMGKAMMGTGEAEGERRSLDAAEAAISNPLLDEVSMKGARGVLINITGGDDLTLFEVDEAANRIRDEVDPDANIIFGSTFEPSMSGHMRVSVVATGIDSEAMAHPRPVSLSLVDATARSQRTAQAAAPAVPMAQAEIEAALAEEPLSTETMSEAEAEETPEAEAEMPEPIEAEAAPEPESAPIAEPEPAEEAFIAPAPAQVEPRAMPAPAMRAETGRSADPFAAAALANSGQRRLPAASEDGSTPAPRKAHSLLAKVTGAARAFHEATQSAGEAEAAPAAPQPATAETATEPQLSQEPAPATPAPTPAAMATKATTESGAESRAETKVESTIDVPAKAPALNQPRLTGLDPAERVGVSQSEEDLLDIPAFLRRQAN